MLLEISEDLQADGAPVMISVRVLVVPQSLGVVEYFVASGAVELMFGDLMDPQRPFSWKSEFAVTALKGEAVAYGLRRIFVGFQVLLEVLG
jgi:hypothetical protein